MAKRVDEILARLSTAAHRGGAFSSDVLQAISEVLPDYPIVSLETGCGKSTVMFSNLASQHFVFAYDDRDAPESSVMMVQSDPDFQAATTTFVYGPTQRTLPRYEFPDGLMFDVILIDGPHGFPFPDLEYALVYERLKPGGILIIDDVHIASIGAMYDILREDRMYDEIGVFSTTGLLRRSKLEGVPSDGDHWYEQNYNVSRFPLPMAKYRPDRWVEPERTLSLRDPAMLAHVAVKALEPAPDGSGARTIDMAASLEVELGGYAGPVTVELTYKTTYADAVIGATIVCRNQVHPLPNHPAMATAHFRFEAEALRPMRMTLLFPAAIPEHDRGNTRYDFRRLGVVIESVRLLPLARGGQADAQASARSTLALDEPQVATAGALPDEGGFVRVLEAYASRYPYAPGLLGPVNPTPQTDQTQPSRLCRLVEHKRDVHIFELLPFDGSDFAVAAARALVGRSATPEERRRLETDSSAPSRVALALELDHLNRKAKAATRLHGLRFGRRLWRTERFFRRNGWSLLAKWTNALLRRYARAKVGSLMMESSQRLLMLTILDKLSAQQASGDRV